MILRILLASILAARICAAQDADLSRKTFDFPAKDGKAARRVEVTYRGKTNILLVSSEQGSSGDYVSYTRSYSVGHAFVIEVDEDRDGFFETIIIHEDTRQPTRIEAFARSRDGSVRPVAREKLEKIKRDSEEMAKLWEKLLPPK